MSARLEIVGAVFPGYEAFEAQLRRSIADAGLESAITLHGFRDDVTDLRKATDIALVPSVADESFGNVVIESLLAQRPVVVADQAGCPRRGRASPASSARAPEMRQRSPTPSRPSRRTGRGGGPGPCATLTRPGSGAALVRYRDEIVEVIAGPRRS